MHGIDMKRIGATLMVAGTAVLARPTMADFIGYSTVRTENGAYVKYELFGNFDGATDTVLNAFHITLVSGSTSFYHTDALNGGATSNVAGTWSPTFILVPGALDSYVCTGGGEGFASGNSTSADPDWGAPGFNQAQIPYGDGTFGPGWFNQNPPNNQGRVNAQGQVKLGQFVIALADESTAGTIFLKVGYNNGTGGGVQFGESNFELLCNEPVDCDGDGSADICGLSADCDANGSADACDIASGFDSDDNGNGIPDACEFPWGDLSRDGIVSAGDFSLLLTAWGSTKPNLADLNRDGVVDGADMTILLDNWGATN
jgi:hypothetical protein